MMLPGSEHGGAIATGPTRKRVPHAELEVGITYRENYMIVVYDQDAPSRLKFRGVPTFEPNPDWVLTGHYEPYESLNSIKLGSVGTRLGEHTYQSPGLAHFQHDDHPYTLQVLRSGGTLNTVFADGTGGVSTYSAGRSLAIADAGEDGQAHLG
jgi:uncharacterized protein